MQLNITTDYAIRMVCLLGDGSTKTLDEISKETKVPRSYVGKIVKRLKRGGLLGSAVGAGGGVFLRKELCNISLYEIFLYHGSEYETEPMSGGRRLLQQE